MCAHVLPKVFLAFRGVIIGLQIQNGKRVSGRTRCDNFFAILEQFSLSVALNLNRGTIFSATILTVGFEYEQVKQLNILMRNAWV